MECKEDIGLFDRIGGNAVVQCTFSVLADSKFITVYPTYKNIGPYGECVVCVCETRHAVHRYRALYVTFADIGPYM